MKLNICISCFTWRSYLLHNGPTS